VVHGRRDDVLLGKAGFSEPPKTWDELKEQALKVARDQGVKYGFLFQGAEYECEWRPAKWCIGSAVSVSPGVATATA